MVAPVYPEQPTRWLTRQVKVQLPAFSWEAQKEIRLRQRLAELIGEERNLLVPSATEWAPVLSLLQNIPAKGIMGGLIWVLGAVFHAENGYSVLWQGNTFTLREEPVNFSDAELKAHLQELLESVQEAYSVKFQEVERISVEWDYYLSIDQRAFSFLREDLVKNLPSGLRWSFETLVEPRQMSRLWVVVREAYEAASPPYPRVQVGYTTPKLPISHIETWIDKVREEAQTLVNRIFVSGFGLSL